MKIDIKDLELIRYAASEGSLTSAARRMHVSQPAASQRLANLQDRLGFVIFERRNGKVSPTAAGNRLVKAAEAVETELRSALRDAQDIVEHRNSRLRIATQCYTCYRWLPFVIREMRSAYPALTVDVVPSATDNPYDALDAGTIDIAVVSNPETGSGLDEHSLFTDEMFAVLSTGHRFADRRFLNPENFTDQNLILYTGRKHAILEEVLNPANISPGRITQVRITEAIVELARAGQGIAVLAGWAFDDFDNKEGLRAVRITRGGFKRTWRAVVDRSCQTDHVNSFVDSVREIGEVVQQSDWRRVAQQSGGGADDAIRRQQI